MQKKARDKSVADRTIKVKRVIHAPRELVFEAFKDAENISRWWGPRGFSTTTYEMDFRVGGKWRYTMHGPDGVDYSNLTVYTEIKEPELIKYDHSSGEENDPHAFEATITLEDRGDQTLINLSLLFRNAEERRNSEKYGAIEGGNQTLQRLEEQLLSRDGFTIEQTFAFPCDLVFEAWVKPEHFTKWFSPKGFTRNFRQADIRPGGVAHYCMTSPEGVDVWGKITYLEIEKPYRLVYLQTFSNPEGGEAVNPWEPDWPLKILTTVVFTEVADGTSVRVIWNPVEASEVELATFDKGRSSMKQGWSGTLGLLRSYLRSLH